MNSVIAGVVFITGLAVGFWFGDFNLDRKLAAAQTQWVTQCEQSRKTAVDSALKDHKAQQTGVLTTAQRDNDRLNKEVKNVARQLAKATKQVEDLKKSTPLPVSCNLTPERVRNLNETLDISGAQR